MIDNIFLTHLQLSKCKVIILATRSKVLFQWLSIRLLRSQHLNEKSTLVQSTPPNGSLCLASGSICQQLDAAAAGRCRKLGREIKENATDFTCYEVIEF
jgi:predicted carbohydrate-binding protein with CBM5 and CBM33 domain